MFIPPKPNVGKYKFPVDFWVPPDIDIPNLANKMILDCLDLYMTMTFQASVSHNKLLLYIIQKI